jgi:hypothetical protein
MSRRLTSITGKGGQVLIARGGGPSELERRIRLLGVLVPGTHVRQSGAVAVREAIAPVIV